jgi:hypothetical protein
MCPSIPPGPLDELEWPRSLRANVVAPSSPARIHGLDVESDLARHYSFSEVILATLTGEPPDEQAGVVIDVCLTFLAPAPVWEAPSNAASLARLSGSPPAGVLATGAVALSEQARFEVQRHADLYRAIDEGRPRFPSAFETDDEQERQRVDRFVAALAARGATPRLPDGRPTFLAALFAALHAIGICAPQQVVALWMLAKLPCLTGEAFSGQAGRIADYPLVIPPYRYVETGDHDG